MLDVMKRSVLAARPKSSPGGAEGPSVARSSLPTLLGASLLVGGVWLAAPQEADAAVPGQRGLEIEGARDRRGLYVGAGLGFGGTFFWYDDFIPASRVDFAIGGGVTKRLTLGANLHVTP